MLGVSRILYRQPSGSCFVVSQYGLMGRNGRLAQEGTLGTRIEIAGIWSLSPIYKTTTRWNNSEETPRGMESTGEIRSMAEKKGVERIITMRPS